MVADFDGISLHNEFRSLMSGGGDSAPAAPGPDPTPEPPEPEAGSPTTTAAEPESTSAAAAPAPPEGAPEGTPPVGQQPTAFDVSDPDIAKAVEIAGTSDPRELAKKLLEYNNRLGELGREVKTLKQSGGGGKPATEPQPQQQLSSSAATRPPAQPEHPAPAGDATPPPEQLDSQVNERIVRDELMAGWSAEYGQNVNRLGTIAQFDPRGNLSGGELAEVDGAIVRLEALLDPKLAERLKLEVSPLDELQRDQAESRLERLMITRERLLGEMDRLYGRNTKLEASFERKRDEHRRLVLSEVRARQHETESEARIETMATDFETEWNTTIDQLFSEQSVPDEDRADIYDAARGKALASGEALKPAELRAFLKKVIETEQQKGDRHHRRKMAEYGRLKAADAAGSAPSGAAAVASPAPTETGDWEDRLRASARAERRALA